MIAKLKLYIVLGVIGLVVGLTIYYWNSYSFVKTKAIQAKTDSIRTEQKKVKQLDSTLFSVTQDIDILKSNEVKNQVVMAQLTKERNNAREEAKRATEAIEHYEGNGLMRFFVFDKQGLFKKGCYKEVFDKPDNICK